ncbi:lysis system i-spanin subunit Rz [Pseudomonas proteolytica]|uniref:lysis system i-spanin subunit Rz n=1 Tax=Pseudomonas proteolytica TaxID=219574 RepID=UPI0014745592|nr:lysis system i-spanin subunit Rz [Pseudomonas proteolytica]NMZ37045.1 lysis protein [Pseudomonas proteolytica]
MTPGQILVVILLAMAISAGGTWQVQEWRMGKMLAEQAGLHQDDLAAFSNAASTQTRQALEKQQAAEQARADLDAKATKEKVNDLAENERLRRAADDSARRLRIAGGCRANTGYLSSPTSTTSLGNAGTVELAPTAGRTVFDIRAGIIADQAALRALQRHVLEFCPQASNDVGKAE